MTITLVTGNTHKLEEWRRLLPADVTLDHVALDLPEIQSLDLVEIASIKAKAAYEIAGKPVAVEDVSVGLEMLGGLPGPFIKFFNDKLGHEALYILAGKTSVLAKATCIIVLYDGIQIHPFIGETSGTTTSHRGQNNFGFDPVFQPDGSDLTYAEMTASQKDSVSHRSKAVAQLVKHLKSAV